MKNIAIITARSGSKGLKDKNIRTLAGIPLMAYSIEAAKKSGIFQEIMVSTDSQLYADIAVSYGANVPFFRSKEMSSDNAGSWDVVEEVLNKYRESGAMFDTVCLLQPTSPLRKAEDIIQGYELLEAKGADAIISVCEVDHSPLRCFMLPEDDSFTAVRQSTKDLPRQALGQYYRANGALYIRRIEYLNQSVCILNSKEYAMRMDRGRSVDIDSVEDFEYAEWYIEKKM